MSEDQRSPVDPEQAEPASLQPPSIGEDLTRLDDVESEPERALPVYEDISATLDQALHGSDGRPSS
jgi:hypothetical protein